MSDLPVVVFFNNPDRELVKRAETFLTERLGPIERLRCSDIFGLRNIAGNVSAFVVGESNDILAGQFVAWYVANAITHGMPMIPAEDDISILAREKPPKPHPFVEEVLRLFRERRGQ